MVYSVELNSGIDMKVDAGSRLVLPADQCAEETEIAESSAGEREDAGDTDNVKAEQEKQQDDAAEAPGVEDVAGQ